MTIPKFATNDPARKQYVSKAINDLLVAGRGIGSDEHRAAISAPYFNPAGFNRIAASLESYDHVRLLIGVEPSEPAAPPPVLPPHLKEHGKEWATLQAWNKAQASLAGQTFSAYQKADRLVRWLQRDSVQVRRLVDRFLHGKTYIVEHPDVPLALAGSSNLTESGLRHNAELNLGVQGDDAAPVLEWYNELWGQSEDYKESLLRLYAPLFDHWEPYDIWMRMLVACYTAAPMPQLTSEDLLWYQRTAVPRLWDMLNKYKGALLADETGLGKTYIVGKLASLALMEGESVLVLCPAAIKDSVWGRWAAEDRLLSHNPHIRRRFYIQSYASFRNDVTDVMRTFRGGDGLSPWELQNALRKRLDYSDCSLIVCDEGHHLRNTGRQARIALRALMTVGARKSVLLSTATPVNNKLADLENLLSLFIDRDDAFQEYGVDSWKEEFKAVEQRLLQQVSTEKKLPLSPEFQREGRLDRILEKVTIRRSRQAVENAKSVGNDVIVKDDGERVQVSFPVVTHRDPTIWAMGRAQQAFVDELCEVLAPPSKTAPALSLLLPFYHPEKYLLTGSNARGLVRVGLARSLILKRTDSSPLAMIRTLLNMNALMKQCLNHLRDNSEERLLTVDDLRRHERGAPPRKETQRSAPVSETDEDPLNTLFQMVVDSDDTSTPERMKAHYDIDLMVEHLRQDRSVLKRLLSHPWADRCRSWDEAISAQVVAGKASKPRIPLKVPFAEDQKLNVLLERLRQISEQPELDPNLRKVLVFSEYADTVHYLHAGVSAAVEADARLDCYRKRVAPAVTGALASKKTRIADKFAPLAMTALKPGDPGQYGDYDILITTDVLAEGLNLQQAGKVINYDLPWNPMRVVQRLGRVDRLGSIPGTVETDCFFPAEDASPAEATDTPTRNDGSDRWRVHSTLRWKLMVAEEALGAQAICPSLPGKGIQVLGASTLEAANDQAYADLRGLGADFMTAQKHAEDHHTMVAGLAPEKHERLSGCPAGVHSCFQTQMVTLPTFVFCVDVDGRDREAEVIAVCRTSDSRSSTTWKVNHELATDRSILLHEANPGSEALRPNLTTEMITEAFEAWKATRQMVTQRINPNQPYGGGGNERARRTHMAQAIAVIREVSQSRPAADLKKMRQAFEDVHWSTEIVRGVRDTLKSATGESAETQYDRLAEYAEVNRMLDAEHFKQPELVIPDGVTLNSWLLLLPAEPQNA